MTLWTCTASTAVHLENQKKTKSRCPTRARSELADAADRGELPEGRLRTDNWGGYGLTADTQEPYGECVNNVMIYGWSDRSRFHRNL